MNWSNDTPGVPFARRVLHSWRHSSKVGPNSSPATAATPRIAGAMSAVLPGAGQAYAGQPRDGVSALLINGLLIATTVELARREQWVGTATVGTVALSFYTGNIFSAVASSHRKNRALARNRLDALGEEFEMHVWMDESGELVPEHGGYR